ncbi:MAG: hypothetical protein EOM12_05740 [Verrucomicrobiae bacterium]|nr:hypothetical protein [Verrucomicrobiae bacterium]
MSTTKTNSDPSLKHLFLSMMQSLSSFGSSFEENDDSEEMDELGPFFSLYESFFELGCYLYCICTYWLLNNRTEKYDEISVKLFDMNTEFFSKFLNPELVKLLFIHRVGGYNDLIFADASTNTLHRHLTQLILYTAHREPREYNFEEEPLELNDSITSFFIRIEIEAFENHIIPAIIENLAIYCDSISTHKEKSVLKRIDALIANCLIRLEHNSQAR